MICVGFQFSRTYYDNTTWCFCDFDHWCNTATNHRVSTIKIILSSAIVLLTTAFLVFYGGYTYYSLHTTLVLKGWALLGTGLAFLAGRTWLRWEDASPVTEETRGESFPHIYHALSLEAIVRFHEWTAAESGVFVWPEVEEEEVIAK